MENTNDSKIAEPCLYSCDSIITNVNQGFIDFTGFTVDELLGKSLIEIGAMIRINTQIHLHNICGKYLGYIFTKLLEAREVDISLSDGKEVNGQVYTFTEKPNSRLDDKLIFMEQILSDNIVGISIHSVPDLILLKANQKYLDFHDSPFNEEGNSIGLPLREIVNGYSGSNIEVITNNVIESRKSSYLKELRFDKFERGITYWDSTRTPIFENGIMKFIMFTTSESTERVLKNQSIEQQHKRIEQQNEVLEEHMKQLEQHKKQLEQYKEQLEQHKELLEKKNIQLFSIIENLSEAVMVTDNKGKSIMKNTEAKKLIYQSDQIINTGDTSKSTKYFDMKGIEIPFEKLPGIRALRGERVRNLKLFVSNPSKERFIEFNSTPIYNSNRDFTMVVSCFHDITEEIEQSRKIEEQKKELEAVIENISDGISIFDDKGQYILFNKSARAVSPLFSEKTYKVGDKNNQLELYNFDGEKIDSENIPACRVMKGEKFKNMRMTVKFPHKTLHLDVSGTPIYDSRGKFTLGVLSSRDMTDYLKHEEAIRSKYEFLNKMIDTFNLPVVRLSCSDLKIVGINKKAFSIIKLLSPNIESINQLEQSKFEDLFVIFKTFKTSEYYQCINEVIKEKKTKYLNKRTHLVNGSQIYWNVIFEPMLEVTGEIQEIIVLIIDVTNEIKSNIVIEKTLRLQGEFIANISHELKTPLNVISSTVQLLNMYYTNGSLDEKKGSVIKYIDSMKQNCYRLSKLITNIVDSSKIEAGFFELNLSNNNIVAVVEEIVMSVTNFTDSKGLSIIFDTDIEEKIIACDPEKIERIVLNLISNAIKFSNYGDEIFVEVKDRNEVVEISVKDNGIGIKGIDLNMIFDRFKQVNESLSRNAQGTGIGLSLVKSIVELHGGSISVESEVGKGSKFTVVLPAQKVMQENMLFSNNLRNISESIQVEFSDVNS